jgi:hypothetical protein
VFSEVVLEVCELSLVSSSEGGCVDWVFRLFLWFVGLGETAS